jgi:hypothetical protein
MVKLYAFHINSDDNTYDHMYLQSKPFLDDFIKNL